MKAPLRLTAQQKTFFRHVYQAGLASPFGDSRIKLETQIAAAAETSKPRRIERAIHQVKVQIAGLERAGKINFNHYRAEDRGLVKAGLLFDFFYDFRERFDRLIRDQIKSGDTPIKVPFADEALGLLQGRGFVQRDALRYFALCYQLRRAYFFLYRTLVGRSPCMKKLRQELSHNVYTHNNDHNDR